MVDFRQALAASIAASKRIPKSRTLRALVHRDFRLLLTANISNDFAMWSLHIAAGWLVFELTGSPFQVGLLFSFRGLASLIVLPLGGGLADRVNGRLLVSLASIAEISAAGGLGALTITDVVEPWHAFAALSVIAAAHGVGNPTRHAMVYDAAGKDDATNAIALNNIGMNTMRALGPAVSGILLGFVGTGGVFFLSAATWVITGLSVGLMRTASTARNSTGQSGQPGFLASIRDGFAYARRDRNVGLVLLLILAFNTLGMSFQQLMAPYAGDVLGLEGRGFGLLMAGVGGGAIAGAIALTTLGERVMQGRVLLVAMAATGFGVMTLAAGALPATVLVLVVMGVSIAAAGSISAVLIQTSTDNAYRGRVTALYLLTFSLQYIGSLPVGALAEAVGLQTTFFIMGAVVVAIAFVLAMTSRIPLLKAADS